MHRMNRPRGLKALALIFPALWLAGCVEYTIETTVNPDGSGLRTERMEATEDPDVGVVAPESFLELMYAGEAYGWSHREEVDDDGDTYHVFQRRTEVADLPSWSGLSDKGHGISPTTGVTRKLLTVCIGRSSPSSVETPTA